MSKVIAIANQKGGCAKTTTAVNLAVALTHLGKKVLVIDADPQGSCTASLGYAEPDDLKVTLANIMVDIVNDEDIDIGEGILHHKEKIDLVPANIELSGLEVSLINVMSREMMNWSWILWETVKLLCSSSFRIRMIPLTLLSVSCTHSCLIFCVTEQMINMEEDFRSM